MKIVSQLHAEITLRQGKETMYCFFSFLYFSRSGILLHVEITETFTIPFCEVSKLYQSVENDCNYKSSRQVYQYGNLTMLCYGIAKSNQERTPTK
jgi:hypothetical protein